MDKQVMLEYLADYLDHLGQWDSFQTWITAKGYELEELPAPFDED